MKEFKSALDAALATLQSIKQQHATAEANKENIFARRPALMSALKDTAERLESAQMRNLRGVVSDDEVATSRSEYQAAHDALVKQNEDEEMATRAMNMAHEFGEATEAIGIARSNYFGAISERIENALRADAKLRSRLINDLVACRHMIGCEADLASGPDGGAGAAQWESVLLACFPVPTSDELLRGVSKFTGEYGGDA